MEPISNNTVSCPNCNSTNVVIYKRGYSLLLGLIWVPVFFFIYAAYWIVTSGYAHEDTTTQNLMFALARGRLITAGLLGLLMGFIGKNELRGKCLDCGKKFRV